MKQRGDFSINAAVADGHLTITLSGDFVGAYAADIDAVWTAVGRRRIRRITISGRGVGAWDTSMLTLVAALMRRAAENKIGNIDFDGFAPDVEKLLTRLNNANVPARVAAPVRMSVLDVIGTRGLRVYGAVRHGITFLRLCAASVGRMARGCAVARRVDWVSAFEDVGPRAVLIVSLISFLIGLILAFVGAAQLKLFGATVYVASLVAIASIRIMGAMMTGIIMAGRTGASYAATIGTMQVNEELDALTVMGINKIDFLVLPRLVAMTVSMPILTLLADVMPVLGGAFIGVVMLGVPWSEYVSYTTMALDAQNFLVGIFHGIVYGIIIALCGCYYGIYCGRNAASVGRATTRAVVASIVWMVVATGLITFLFEVLGL